MYAAVQEDLYRAVGGPEHESCAMIGSLIGCAFVSGGLRQAIRVRRFLVERTLSMPIERDGS